MIKELRDIKPNVEIPDNSLIILSVSLFTLIVLAILLYLLLKPKRKKRKKLTPLEIKKKELKELDFDNDKDVAYTFTTHAGEFTNEKNLHEYEEILKQLEPYKYKKEIPKMDKELKKRIKRFIDAI